MAHIGTRSLGRTIMDDSGQLEVIGRPTKDSLRL